MILISFTQATQVAALMETLDEATRFTDTASDKGFKETELAVKRAVYKVELLAKVWKVSIYPRFTAPECGPVADPHRALCRFSLCSRQSSCT